MKNLYLFFISGLLLYSGIGYGQKDYKPGYIITNNNDTVSGFINLKSNYTNSRQCEFKKNIDQDPHTYLPFDIKGYRIENYKYYISKKVTLNDTTKKVFLEYLVNGIVDLYYLKELTSEYYFIEKDSTLYLLSNDKEEITKKEKVFNYAGLSEEYRTYSRNSNQYIGILTYLFLDSPGISKDISRTEFSYKPLIKITKEYHNSVCKDYECIDYSKTTRSPVYVESYAGIINSCMGLKTSSHKEYNTYPIIGLNFKITPLKVLSSWALMTGISYTKNNFLGEFENTLLSPAALPRMYQDTFVHQVKTKYSVLRVPLAIEYTFPTGKLQPSIIVGYNNVFMFNQDCYVKIYYPDTQSTGNTYDTYMINYHAGIFAGVNIKYNVSNSSYIYLRSYIENRKMLQSPFHFLDFQHIRSILINFGYGLKIN